MKICKVCKIEKPNSDYYKESRCASGYRAKCKTCHISESFKSCRRTPERFLNKMYLSMKARVNGSGDEKQQKTYKGIELCSKEEFISKFIDDKKYIKMYKSYIKSEYDKDLAPSPDRINTNQGYIIENIRIIPFRNNYMLASRNRGN